MAIPYARKTGAAVFGLLMCSAIPAILTANPYLSIAWVSLAMFGYTGYLANALAFPAEVFPKNALGSIWGLASMGSGLGGMLFQWLSGRMVDRFGYYPVFIGYGSRNDCRLQAARDPHRCLHIDRPRAKHFPGTNKRAIILSRTVRSLPSITAGTRNN